MRVGLVCPYDWSYPGGVKSHIEGLRDALVDKGIEVLVCAPSAALHPDITTVGRSLGIPFNGSVARIAFTPASRVMVRQWLESSSLDLVHLHEPLVPSVSMFALSAADVPCVGTFHASASRGYSYALGKPFLGRLAAKLDQKITVSSAARDLVERFFPGPYQTIPNGIDYKRFSDADEHPDLEALKPFVLFVGRPEPRKGFEVAVQVMEQVREVVDINFVVVGHRKEKVPTWAHALGEVPNDQLPSIYATASVYLAPSLGGESFGIVLAEAMASGTPVVCSDIPGYREASAGAALTFPTGRSDDAAARVLSILEDETLRVDLIRRGTLRARELDWQRVSEQVLDSYRRAVS